MLGTMAFGFFGGIMGAVIGHYFDQGLAGHINPKRREEIQHAFFKATFQVMGHIAKSDGRVSEREIHVARAIMAKYAAGEENKKRAIHYFNQGKSDNFDLNITLTEFSKTCAYQRSLVRAFIEIQLQAAYADGFITEHKKFLLQEICRALNFAQLNFQFFDTLYGRFGAGGGSYQRGYQGNYQHQQQSYTRPNDLAKAYALLETSADASDQDVKKAYRKQMSEHHPDKLASKGLPPEMMEAATEKAQEIQKAYEQIKQARGIK